MNVEIGTERTRNSFSGKEYINGIFVAVWLSDFLAYLCFSHNLKSGKPRGKKVEFGETTGKKVSFFWYVCQKFEKM
jgi:hypothetical protein